MICASSVDKKYNRTNRRWLRYWGYSPKRIVSILQLAVFPVFVGGLLCFLTCLLTHMYQWNSVKPLRGMCVCMLLENKHSKDPHITTCSSLAVVHGGANTRYATLTQWWNVTKYVYSSTVLQFKVLEYFHCMQLYTCTLHLRNKYSAFYSTTFVWHL